MIFYLAGTGTNIQPALQAETVGSRLYLWHNNNSWQELRPEEESSSLTAGLAQQVKEAKGNLLCKKSRWNSRPRKKEKTTLLFF